MNYLGSTVAALAFLVSASSPAYSSTSEELCILPKLTDIVGAYLDDTFRIQNEYITNVYQVKYPGMLSTDKSGTQLMIIEYELHGMYVEAQFLIPPQTPRIVEKAYGRSFEVRGADKKHAKYYVVAFESGGVITFVEQDELDGITGNEIPVLDNDSRRFCK